MDEFYRIAFRKKIYRSIDELQADLDAWLVEYNYRRPTSRPLVLRQDPDADLSRRTTTGKGKTHGGMTTGDSHIGSHS